MYRLVLRGIIAAVVVVIGIGLFSPKQQPVAPESVSVSVAVDRVKAGDFAPGQLQSHFIKHGYQFGAIGEEDYLEGAKKLLDAAPGKDVLEKTRDNGDTLHFKPSTGEFAVMTKTGRIRTYFKTDRRYWDKQ